MERCFLVYQFRSQLLLKGIRGGGGLSGASHLLTPQPSAILTLVSYFAVEMGDGPDVVAAEVDDCEVDVLSVVGDERAEVS